MKDGTNSQARPATEHTRAVNATVTVAISFDDPGDFVRAGRGLVATHPSDRIASLVG